MPSTPIRIFGRLIESGEGTGRDRVSWIVSDEVNDPVATGGLTTAVGDAAVEGE